MSVLASGADRKGQFQEEKATHTLLGVGKRRTFQYPPTSQLCHLLQAGMILGLSSFQCPVVLLLAARAGPMCPRGVTVAAAHRAGAHYVIAVGGFYTSILSAGPYLCPKVTFDSPPVGKLRLGRTKLPPVPTAPKKPNENTVGPQVRKRCLILTWSQQ